MKHTTFVTISIISFNIIIIFAVTYDYIIISNHPHTLISRFVIKPIPLFVLIINTIGYLFIYKINLYSLIIMISFIFCMIGDILLMFYIPSIKKYNNIIFLILGGVSFAIARIFMTVSSILHPFKYKFIIYQMSNTINILLVSIPILLYFVIFGMYMIINISNKIMGFVIFFYFIIMGIQTYLSVLRIKGLKQETLISQILGTLGTIMFDISDTLLFLNMFVNKIPYGNVISITIYWCGMYCIAISIVRSSNKVIEKKGNFDYNILPQ